MLRRGIVARELGEVCAAVGLHRGRSARSRARRAEAIARAARKHTGSTHALAVLIDLDEGADRIEFAGTICLAIADGVAVESRRSRIVGGRDWVRLGAVEMGLDCLRRYLQGLPVAERIDFEKGLIAPIVSKSSRKRDLSATVAQTHRAKVPLRMRVAVQAPRTSCGMAKTSMKGMRND